MDDTLSYTNLTKTRRSRLAITAGIIGLFGPPICFGAVYALFHLPLVVGAYINIVFAMCILFLLAPICAIIFGIIALIRIERSRRPGIWPPLTGLPWAIAGIIASVLWPPLLYMPLIGMLMHN
jgi:hypothetical protein